MLHSYESRNLLHEFSASIQQAAFMASKVKTIQTAQMFTSESRGFVPATISTNLASKMGNKLTLGPSSAAKSAIPFVRTEEELKAALTKFKSVSQICLKPGHPTHHCFKRLNFCVALSPRTLCI